MENSTKNKNLLSHIKIDKKNYNVWNIESEKYKLYSYRSPNFEKM